MKHILFFASLIFIYSCSNPNYNANPSSITNNSTNPLNPNASKYDWSGNQPISALINGSPWQADAWSLVVDTVTYPGYLYFSGNVGGKTTLKFWLMGATAGNVYRMGWLNGGQFAVYIDSITAYSSYYALLGTGGVKILQNDLPPTSPAFIKGLFFFEGKGANNLVVNVTNGYFSFQKW